MDRLDAYRDAILDERHKLVEIRDTDRPEVAPLNAAEVDDQNNAAYLSLTLEKENVQSHGKQTEQVLKRWRGGRGG